MFTILWFSRVPCSYLGLDQRLQNVLAFLVFFFSSESSVLTEWPHPALVFGKITCCMSCPWRGDRTPLSRSNGVCIGIEVETTNSK